MREVVETARRRSGFTQAAVAKKLFLSVRQYQRIIDGELPMSPEVVVRVGEALGRPQITMVYCRKSCPIGQRYCYEVLNNVDLSPTAILTKYRQQNREFNSVLDGMAEIFLNKRSKEDCTQEDLSELARCSLEMLDLGHVIETMKLSLWDFLDVGELVKAHNKKCLVKRYVDQKKPGLQLVG